MKSFTVERRFLYLLMTSRQHLSDTPISTAQTVQASSRVTYDSVRILRPWKGPSEGDNSESFVQSLKALWVAMGGPGKT
jgi:hypothetical protein